MTSSSNVRRFMAAAATALVLPFTFAANANAASTTRTVELSQLDLSKPLPSAICFKDSSKGTAVSKIITVMKARNQKSIIVADKYTPTGQFVEMFTSNLVQVDKDIPNLFGEGYNIAGSSPSNVVSSGYCMNRLQSTYVVYNEAIQKIPGSFAKGELGQALSNASQQGSKFAFGALTELGTLMAVRFNPQSKDGAVLASDGGGNNTVFYAIGNAGYSANLTADARNAIGLPPVAQAAAPSVTLARR